MNFASGLIKKAELWLGCKETTTDRSACVDEIHTYYNGKTTAEAWCAKFVFMITDLVSKDFGIKNLLPRTASTVNMVNSAKSKGLRVDTFPAPGSIFFRSRGGGFGHVGFVVEVKGATIVTIEGNMSNKVGYGKHTNLSGYKFIHTEEMPKLNGKPDVGIVLLERPDWLYTLGNDLLTDNNYMYLAAGVGLVGGSYYLLKNKLIG